MLYAWINENKILCTTFDLNFVPEKYKNKVVVFEDLDVHDYDKLYVDENGQIKKKTNEMLIAEMKEKLLNELKNKIYTLLQSTDWVVIKCVELGKDIKKEYPEIAQKRQQIREINEKLEKQINSATTIEELEKIQQEIAGLR